MTQNLPLILLFHVDLDFHLFRDFFIHKGPIGGKFANFVIAQTNRYYDFKRQILQYFLDND